MTVALPTATVRISIELLLDDNHATGVISALDKSVSMPLDEAVDRFKDLAGGFADTEGAEALAQPVPATKRAARSKLAEKRQRVVDSAKAANKTVECPEPGCGKTANGAHGLQVHRARAHKTPVPAPGVAPHHSSSEDDTGDATGELLLRCHEEECDATFKPTEASKMRSHVGQAHRRNPLTAEMTPSAA